MLLRSSAPASSFVASHTPSAAHKRPAKPNDSTKSCRFLSFSAAKGTAVSCARRRTVKAAQSEEAEATALTGVVFQPFEELKSPLVQIPSNSSHSLARHQYAPACEAAVNEQINVEYSVSYVYHALYAYFDRDNVALPGFARFFKESSDEEREHAEKFMKYQNMRGGRVQLHSVLQPALLEFDHPEKGDALYAMEISLSLEKLTNEKLLALHEIADENDDPQLQDFIESEYLDEQVATIKKVSEYVSQLRRIGKGHGVYHFDRLLQNHKNGNGAVNVC